MGGLAAMAVPPVGAGGRETFAVEAVPSEKWVVLVYEGNPPNPSPLYGDGLKSVACQSATACTAAGFTNINGSSLEAPLAETWNGTIWSVVTTPDPSGATGARFCWTLRAHRLPTARLLGTSIAGRLAGRSSKGVLDRSQSRGRGRRPTT